MQKIIIHIGPGKCGSSSIQNFFKDNQNPCSQKTAFVEINPEKIETINNNEVKETELAYFNTIINDHKNSEVLILSHEYLFQCAIAIKNICALSLKYVSEIILIGYSRRQSDFIISAYSQWLYRSPERVAEVNETLIKNEINPLYFSGVERQIIASIANDFYSARQISNGSILEWKNSYENVKKITAPFNVKIKAGTLPTKHSKLNLIEDFCEKAGLNLNEEVKEKSNLIANPSFNTDLIETINCAILEGVDVASLNITNENLFEISDGMKKVKKTEDVFLTVLKQYTDNYYLNSNIEFCNQYAIDPSYFESTNQNSKIDVLKLVQEEEQKRISSSSTLAYYKKLSATMAETCLYLINNQPKSDKETKPFLKNFIKKIIK